MSNRPHSKTGIGLIAGYNRQLEATLQGRFRMTLGVYKVIESLAATARHHRKNGDSVNDALSAGFEVLDSQPETEGLTP